MKAIVCELCGSNDIIKQDGTYVCQHCGTKYTPEEAKKMMVDVSGSTVKVDVSDELANLYQIARRAKDDNNSENAAKYYDMVLVKDPKSWEASFYVVYFTAMGCKIAQIQSAAYSVANCIDSVLHLITENVSNREEQIKAVTEVAMKSMLISLMFEKAALNHYNGISLSIQDNYRQELVNNCFAARDIDYNLGNSIDAVFNDFDELRPLAVEAWKAGVVKHKKMMCNLASKEENKNVILEYVKKIRKYDESYPVPEISTSSGGGCYVATAVYGSYDCPQVWTLRRYRDNTLAETWYGRAFIRTYYAISPTLVKWFGETAWFKNLWKPKLDEMVKKLNNEGVENTPYNDKQW